MRYVSIYLVVIFGALGAGCFTVHAPPPQVASGHDQMDLVLPNFPGPGTSNLGALKGKVLLVDFWATWCGPCHEAATAYQKLFDQQRASGLEVYGVSIDEDSAQIAAFLKQQGVSYPILLDPAAQLSQPRFSLAAVPSVLLVDRTGRIRFTHAGFNDDELAKITSEIQLLLAEQAPPR